MATYKSRYSAYNNDNYNLKLIVTEIIPSDYISTNKTIINAYLYAEVNNSSYGYYNLIGSLARISINGKNYDKSNATFDGRSIGDKLLYSVENIEIEHKTDGKKTISVGAYHDTGVGLGSASISDSVELITIPRASLISVSNYDLGQNPNIVIGRKVDSFTSTLSYKIGERTGTLVTNYNDKNYVWSMSEELINQIKIDNPSNSEVDAIVYCDTYNGDAKIGDTQSTTFKLFIKDKPIITDVIRDELNSYVSTLTDKVLRSISENQFTITATAPTGTIISSYKVTNGTQNSGNVTSNVVNLNDIQTFYESEGILKTKFIFTCIDARGNVSEEYPLELDFIDYVNVSINKTDVKISRSTNTTNDAFLSLKGNFYNGLIGETQNELIIQYKFKEQGTTEYSELKTINATYENNTFKIDNLEIEKEINYQENYEFVFYVTDLVNDGDTYTYIYASSIPTEIHHKNGAYIRKLDTDEIRVKGKNITPSDDAYIHLYCNGDKGVGMGFNHLNFLTKLFSKNISYTSNIITIEKSGLYTITETFHFKSGVNRAFGDIDIAAGGDYVPISIRTLDTQNMGNNGLSSDPVITSSFTHFLNTGTKLTLQLYSANDNTLGGNNPWISYISIYKIGDYVEEE